MLTIEQVNDQISQRLAYDRSLLTGKHGDAEPNFMAIGYVIYPWLCHKFILFTLDKVLILDLTRLSCVGNRGCRVFPPRHDRAGVRSKSATTARIDQAP